MPHGDRRNTAQGPSVNKRVLLLLCLLHGLSWGQVATAIEEPSYEVLSAEGPFEVRRYAPVLIAETVVDGDIVEAINRSFRLIADFIFENNPLPESERAAKIALTVPVIVEPLTTTTHVLSASRWRIKFVISSPYTSPPIPEPKDMAVSLREVPSKYFVVLKHSGLKNSAELETKTNEAIQWATQRSLKVIATPQTSNRDLPWTLPMVRSNAILIEVSNP
jgi:hypothetical protein